MTLALLPVTHDYVLAELVALAETRGLSRRTAIEFLSELDAGLLGIEVVFVGPDLYRAALGLLLRRADKRWSLCDALSFEIMQSRGIREALTTDRHFEQAGFVRLLTP